MSYIITMNLVELLGKIERDNTDLSFYEDNPELFDLLGEKGIKVTEGNLLWDILNFFTPKDERGRMQTFGNQIYVPTDEWDEEYLRNMLLDDAVPYEGIGEMAVFEEAPHVQQFRDKGFVGMWLSGLESTVSRGAKNIFTPEKVLEEHGEDAYLGLNPVELQKTFYDTSGTEEEFHGDESMKRDLLNALLGEGAYMEHRGWPYTENEEYPGVTYQGNQILPSGIPYDDPYIGEEGSDLIEEYWFGDEKRQYVDDWLIGQGKDPSYYYPHLSNGMVNK